jgi:hypothetical protein
MSKLKQQKPIPDDSQLAAIAARALQIEGNGPVLRFVLQTDFL